VTGRAVKLLADVLHVPADAITEDLAMREMDGWDSLRHMELVVSLEQAFGIQLTFEEIVAMTTVRGIAHVLSARGVDD
jgi:acyl carrier protein